MRLQMLLGVNVWRGVNTLCLHPPVLMSADPCLCFRCLRSIYKSSRLDFQFFINLVKFTLVHVHDCEHRLTLTHDPHLLIYTVLLKY